MEEVEPANAVSGGAVAAGSRAGVHRVQQAQVEVGARSRTSRQGVIAVAGFRAVAGGRFEPGVAGGALAAALASA